jgi:hypothetical protein
MQWWALKSSIQPSVYIIGLLDSTLVTVQIANLQNIKPWETECMACKYKSSVAEFISAFCLKISLFL